MLYLVFTTETDAQTANAQIGVNLGLPTTGLYIDGQPNLEARTTVWAVPVQRLDGNWVFPKPDDSAMVGVTAEAETYDPSWFPQTII